MTELHTRISLKLKALRKEKGWSLDKAAAETGVSKAMLGQIEREESSPTISTLWKIASGFNTPFSAFIAESPSDLSASEHSIAKTEQLHPSDKKIRVVPLFPFDNQLHCEIFVIELLPMCEQLSPPHNAGVIEHVIVVAGSMEVFLDGAWKALRKGEGLRFNANQKHGYRNMTDEVACFHDIIHYPALT